MKIKKIVLVSSRGVLVIGSTDVSTTDILIFTVMIIGTDNQKKLQYALGKLICIPRSALLQNGAEWFLDFFYLCLLHFLCSHVPAINGRMEA